MFRAGDKVILNLEKLWEMYDMLSGGAHLSNHKLCHEGGISRDGDYFELYSKDGICLAVNVDVAPIEVKKVDMDQKTITLKSDLAFKFGIPYDITLDIGEAVQCLTLQPEKEKSFLDTFEEVVRVANTETLSNIKANGQIVSQEEKVLGEDRYKASIYLYNNKSWFVAYRNGELLAFKEYTGELPQKTKSTEDAPKKRVVQISVDIEIGADENGDVVAEQIAEELENNGRIVLGSAFQGDMSLEYDYEVER